MCIHEHAAVSVTMLGALPPWRGVAPYTCHLVQGLEEVEGVDIEFIDFASLYPPRLYPGGEPRSPDGDPPNFRRVSIRRILAWYNPLSWLRAGLTLRGQVVHAQWWSYALAPVYLTVLAIARLRGRQVVLTLHNVHPHEEGRWHRWLYHSVFRLAHHFIVHSERNAEALRATYPAADGRVTVVPLGVHSVTASGDLSREEARQELGLSPDRPVILAFGNIRRYKGVDVLLRSFRRVLDCGDEATLVIAGQPWVDFAPYQRIIDELALGASVHVRLGYIPEGKLQAYFTASDLAVFPYTHFDAQSAAATVALSFGVPILVSDVGGLRELVDDPRAVVPPNDVDALAQAIRAVLADGVLRAKLAADARRRAGELGWGTIARRTTEVYRTVLATKRAGQELS